MHLPVIGTVVLELVAVHALLLFRIIMHPVVIDLPILTSGQIPLTDRECRVELIGWREKPVGQELIYGLRSDIATETLKSEPFTILLDINGINQSGPGVSLKQRFPFFKRQFDFPTLGHDLATILTSYGGDELFAFILDTEIQRGYIWWKDNTRVVRINRGFFLNLRTVPWRNATDERDERQNHGRKNSFPHCQSVVMDLTK